MTTSTPAHAVVVGGGLAGLSAALDCADAGLRVTVVERRPRLGGLTWSFEHDGHWVDNGQHVFLRCCTEYRSFLERIGAAGDVELQERLDIAVIQPSSDGGPPSISRLRRDAAPAPLHLARSLVRFAPLTITERLRLGQAVLPLRRLRLGDPALDGETFGSWLRRHGQSARAIRRLWDLITVATVNLPADEASLAVGAKVFQTGLLTDRDAADIGWARVPLGQLHGGRAGRALADAGAEVRLGERVLAIETGQGRPGFAVRTGHGTLEADAVIVAVAHDALAGLLPPATVASQERLIGLGTSPIVNVHVIYDRPVMAWPLAAAVDSAAQWVFDRTRSSGMGTPGGHGPSGPVGSQPQYLAVSLSSAEREMGRHPDDLGATITRELPRLFPAARDAEVLDVMVTKERAATFRAVPGTARLRPPAVTAVAGLAVAGSWTDTGWPATMEGAVRSGRAAARAVITATGLTRLLPEEVA
jgi:squalene-associated FAD-dependent desaturase